MRAMTWRVPAILVVCAAAVLFSATPVAAQGGVGFGVGGGVTRATYKFDGASDFLEGRSGWMAGIWFGGNRNGVVGVMGELDYVVKKTGSVGTDDERGGPHPLDRFSSQLRWNPIHDSSCFVCWLSSSPSVSVRFLRRPAVERRVGPAPVVEVHPQADSSPGLGASSELGQVDALVFE